jgi:putative hydrolase
MNNFDDENENNSQNPFGFDFDPSAFSGMINDMMGQASSFGFAGANQSQGPMDIAQRVAADIASREVDDMGENPPETAEANNGDPMAEIIQIMTLLATPPSVAKKLDIDQHFEERCEQIYPAAQNYVAQQSGADDLTALPLVVTDRVTWSKDYLSSMQGPLAQASKSLSPTFGPEDEAPIDPTQGLDIQSIIAKTVAPMMFGVQAGTMVGFLSHRAYGDDDVLLPASLPERVGMIASAVQKFADDWSVQVDEAILYFLILQTLRAHIRRNGWLTNRLNDLCTQYVAAYELNPYKLQELMGDINMENPESVMAINVTPEQMFQTLRTPAHDVLDEEIGRISSLHDAYVEFVMHKDLETLLPNYRIIQEARKRITVTTSDADRFVEQLFGVALSPQTREKADAFIAGVIERDGEALLHQMWYNEEMIPTESEFDAPGLWMARLEMM